MPSVQATSEPSREPVSLPSILDEYPQSLPLQCGDKPENKPVESYKINIPTKNEPTGDNRKISKLIALLKVETKLYNETMMRVHNFLFCQIIINQTT